MGQRERLARIKQAEEDLAEGAESEGDPISNALFSGAILVAVGSLFGTIGYLIWQNSQREKACKKFLEEMALDENVIKRPSGLLYKVERKGEGKFHPTLRANCKCNYRGTLIDGTEFDSSYKHGKPADLQPIGLIRGWTEALRRMVEGDKWTLYIPAELAYGNNTQGSIPGNSALIFELELVQIQGEQV